MIRIKHLDRVLRQEASNQRAQERRPWHCYYCNKQHDAGCPRFPQAAAATTKEPRHAE